MKTRLLGGIVALVLAIVGTLLLVSYVQGSEARAQQNLQPVDVLVVQNQIPSGATFDTIKAAVKLVTLPQSSVPNGALKSLDGLQGKVASTDLLPGEALLGARLVDPTTLAAPGSVPVPPGMQEISVQLDAQRVIGGRLQPGDTVGVIMLFSDGTSNAAGGTAQQVFHKVLVTSVQRAESKSSTTTQDPQAQTNTQVPSGSLLVTLARNDVDSAKIALAAQFGTIWLTKEPATTKESAPTVVKMADVFR